MTPFAMKYYNVAAAIAVAQPSLLRALASDSWSPKWPGNKGQCAVDPQPGYNFTALQICTTGKTSYTTPDTGDNSGTTYYMDGSLYSAFLLNGSDPVTALQPVGPTDWWVNIMQYGVYNDINPENQPLQFYPPGYDINTCAKFACQDGQPCAPWGNAGTPWDVFDNENTAGAFTWWNGTRQETYGPGKGYILLDYMNTNPPVFNERDTGNTWYICTQATREPCTDVAGVIVNYLYDCKPNFGHGGTKLIPPPYNSGGINNKGDFACGAEGNDHAIRILQAAVQEKFADSDITALSGQPMYCNWDANGDNSNVCVYYQGTATGNGTLTDYLMTQMNNAYDSDTCGNIPVDYPEVDWLAFNYLTVSSNTPPCEPCTSFDVTDVVTGKVISTTTCACPGFPS